MMMTMTRRGGDVYFGFVYLYLHVFEFAFALVSLLKVMLYVPGIFAYIALDGRGSLACSSQRGRVDFDIGRYVVGISTTPNRNQNSSGCSDQSCSMSAAFRTRRSCNQSYHPRSMLRTALKLYIYAGIPLPAEELPKAKTLLFCYLLVCLPAKLNQ